jgi:uncharacterized protein DUF541
VYRKKRAREFNKRSKEVALNSLRRMAEALACACVGECGQNARAQQNEGAGRLSSSWSPLYADLRGMPPILAIADARRKAEVYARPAGIQLGRVEWIAEDSGFAPPVPMRSQATLGATGAAVPIASGEDTLHVRITVGFDIAR